MLHSLLWVLGVLPETVQGVECVLEEVFDVVELESVELGPGLSDALHMLVELLALLLLITRDPKIGTNVFPILELVPRVLYSLKRTRSSTLPQRTT